MKIAVCDDSLQYRQIIINNLKCHSLIPDLSYTEFSCSEDLLCSYNNGERFDIIFLDVEMGEIDGVEAGIRIREYDSKAIIIFISNYPQYAIPAYDCEAFYFIVKPIEPTKFIKVISKAIERYKLFNQYYIIKNKGQVKKIAINDIYYVEIYRKHLIFHTITGKYETIGKISEALTNLSPYGFCQIHQGYLVNMSKIKDFDEFDIILDNNEKVMISVRKKAEVLRTYANYLERNF